MAHLPPLPGTTGRRDWRTARDAIRRLLADGDDTTQVFRIMAALNTGTAASNYSRLLATTEGGRIAVEQAELSQRLSDAGFVASFAPGTVGAAYRDWLATTGYSADGLADVSRQASDYDMVHPYVWMGRRIRDSHDIWHVLTGYQADEHMGEACLVAFSFAQVGGLGWALIASAAALKSLRATGGTLFAKAILEGYRHGRRAKWVSGEDYLKLLHEPLDQARARLGIATPHAYLKAQRELGPALTSYMAARKPAATDPVELPA